MMMVMEADGGTCACDCDGVNGDDLHNGRGGLVVALVVVDLLRDRKSSVKKAESWRRDTFFLKEATTTWKTKTKGSLIMFAEAMRMWAVLAFGQ